MSLASLKQSAQRATSLSALMSGRTQVSTDTLVNNTVTPVAVDIASVNGKNFPVFLFAELPDSYYNGGTVLMKIVDVWIADYDGDLDALNEDLEKNSGDIRFHFRASKTKTGNNLTVVDVL